MSLPLKPPADSSREHPLFDHSMPVGLMSGDSPRFPSAPGGHEALKRDLDAMGVQHEETQGHYGGPERSIIAYGLPREHLVALGKKYGQEAVIHNEGGKREFIYTNGPHAGTTNPGLPSHEHWPEGSEAPEDYYTKLPGAGYVRLHFNADKFEPTPVMPGAPMPASLTTPVQSPMTKHEIAYQLYQKLMELKDV